jgi:ABC-type Zn uptake system ZnuABC Zn-binding protein ZnuA
MACRTHADVIALWPSKAEFARAIGTTGPNVTMMARQGIPPKHFQAVVDAVAKAGFPPITYAELTQMKREKDD